MAPNNVPNEIAVIMDVKPIRSEMRPPYRRRLSMSRPPKSVPSQCAALGAAVKAAKSP